METRLNWSWTSILCFISCLLLMTTADTSTPANDDTCASHPCENGGSCTAYTNAFICKCTEQFSGLQCETLVSEQGQTACVSMPCVNGECVSTDPLHFTCMCPPGWRGNTCNIDVNECTVDNSCQHGAFCENTEGSYTCRCTAGFTGRNCERDASCTTNICSNNGTCVLESDEPTCICPPRYSGDTCTEQVGCSTNPCQNGDCLVSADDPNGYVCRCHSGYTARLCDRVLHVACSHDGNTFYDNEMRNDNCNQCHCRAGEWLCTKKYCGSISVRFDFIGDYSSVVEGKEDSFKSYLITNLAQLLSIDERMIANLVVSAGSIHVEFSLVALVESLLNIEDVAADLLSKLDSGAYYLRFDGASLFVDTSSVKLEKVDPSTDDPGSPVISNVTLVVVCVLVSVLLVVAVIVGTVVILMHRNRSEQTSLGQFRGREKHEEYPVNNTKHHNELYDSVPDADKGGNLKDINIAMFKEADVKPGRV